MYTTKTSDFEDAKN